MRTPTPSHRNALSMIALGATLVALAFAPVASADVWATCLPQVRDAAGSNVLVGDGPLVGDEPDGVDTPVVLSCYTGGLDSAEDVDSYNLAPGWHTALGGPTGMRFDVWGIEGCFQYTFTVVDTGLVKTRSICEGERQINILLGLHDVRLAFHSGPGDYQFAFE